MVYLVAAFGEYDPAVIRNTWTIRDLLAMISALKIKYYVKLSIAMTVVQQMLSGASAK